MTKAPARSEQVPVERGSRTAALRWEPAAWLLPLAAAAARFVVGRALENPPAAIRGAWAAVIAVGGLLGIAAVVSGLHRRELRPALHGGIGVALVVILVASAIAVGGRAAPAHPAPRPGGVKGAQTLKAQVIVVVRNFESTIATRGPLTEDLAPTEPPFLVPARLELRLADPGELRVRSGDALVSAAKVEFDASGGAPRLSAADEQTPIPRVAPDGSLVVLVPPGASARQPVVVEQGPPSSWRQELTLETTISDVGRTAVGHSYIEDVGLADGHFHHEAEDIDEGLLSFHRTYDSHILEESPLGPGWTHSFRLFARAEAERAGVRRYLLFGSSTGQVYTCRADGCSAQRGYHSTFREEADAVVFRSKSGQEFRYRRTSPEGGPDRYRVESITDAVGRQRIFEYGLPEAPDEVTRIREPARRRSLQLTYAPGGAGMVPGLERVELLESVVAEGASGAATVARCVEYRRDDRGNLVAVRRYAGGCSGVPESAQDYRYLAGPPGRATTA